MDLTANIPVKESKTAKKSPAHRKKKKGPTRKVMVRVSKGSGEFVLMEPFEFQKNCSILRDEVGRLRSVRWFAFAFAFAFPQPISYSLTIRFFSVYLSVCLDFRVASLGHEK